jgi:cytochrome c oxidase subunit 3
LTAEKQKNNTFKKESELRLSDARYVVEGANLKRNEYGSKLFADFFFLSPVSWISRSQV